MPTYGYHPISSYIYPGYSTLHESHHLWDTLEENAGSTVPNPRPFQPCWHGAAFPLLACHSTIGIGTAEHFPVLTHSKGSVLPSLKMFKAHVSMFFKGYGEESHLTKARSICPMMPSIRHLLGCCPGCRGWPREDLGFRATTTSLHPGAIFKYLTLF